MMETDSGGSNRSIFEDLLNEDNQDLTTDFSTDQCKPPDDAVCELSDQDRVMSCGMDVRCLSRAQDFLAVLCSDESETVMLVYSMSALEKSNPKKSDRPADVLAVRLSLPQCSFPSHSVNQSSRLTVVASENTCLSSSQVSVPSHLFSILFGWEISVRSLPVVVCSTPDGSVYFHAVDLTVRYPPHTSWKLLCVVDSPVVDVLFMTLNRTLTEQESATAQLHNALGLPVRTPSHATLDALLVVGASGKCCLTVAMPPSGSAAFSSDCHKVVAMFTLPGNVGSVCCRESALYVSAGACRQIQKCQVRLVRQGEGERRQFGVEVQAEPLFSASVSFMGFSGGGTSLMCRTVNGDLIEIESEPAPEGARDHSLAPTSQPSLRDLLLGVDVSQASLDQLKDTHLHYNAFLQQMNVAAYLLHQSQHLRGMGPEYEAHVSCKISVQSEVTYHAAKYFLLVEVTNGSSVALTKDWSLVVIQREMSAEHDPKLTEHDKKEPSVTYSSPLFHELGPGRQTDFRIPVSYSPTSCGVKVDASLVLNIPENLRADLSAQHASRDCLFVPMAACVVDVFHFLHLKQTGSAVLSPCEDPQTCLERKVAELKRCGQSKRQLVEKPPSGQMFCISEYVSARSTPVETLCSLLSESQVKLEQLLHTSCSLQTPCGCLLMMSVEPTASSLVSASSNHNEEGKGKVHAVTIKSSSISLLARARLALSRRLRDLGCRHTDATVEEFRRVIRKTEAFQQQLQEIQGHWDKGDNTFPGTLSDLCAVYEKIHNDAD
ncbi:hypothetical protein ACOMHN_047748 [Nucella lapillus]